MLEQNENIIEEVKDIDSNNEVNSNEQIIESVNEEISYSENLNEEKSVKPSFMDTLKANLLDLIVIGGISTIIVFISDVVLKFAGYTISEKFQMSFVIFMVIMVLYMSIMESGKNNATLGKKIAGLIITKG